MSLCLSTHDLEELFPAYLRTDECGGVVAAGPSLEARLPADFEGRAILELFEVERPIRVRLPQDLLIHQQCVSLHLRALPALKLQGIIHERDGAFFFLLGHMPSIDSGTESLKYRFSDFAPFDGSKDIFLAAQIRKGLLNDTQDLAEQLKKEKQTAVEANSAKSKFLACMSHEIRTPLNGVLGLAALLQRTQLTDHQARMLKSLRDCGSNLLELLNDIIDISRMDADRLEIVHEPLSLREVADKLYASYAVIADEKDLTFRVHLSEQLRCSDVLGDSARIAQVLNNLVSNALKFTDEGRVLVEITPLDDPDRNCRMIRFEVRDSGIGINPENLARIFEPFTQADTGITRRFGGTGLGLSICHRLCGMMGGEISVSSEPGEGSVFHFTIPLRFAQAEDDQDLRRAAG